jgi:urease accessory protein
MSVGKLDETSRHLFSPAPSHARSPIDPEATGWSAEIALAFAHAASGEANDEGGDTWLARCRHRGPLVVQRPFFPEGREVCHVYLLHPPGGLVGGDRMNVAIEAGERAHALVTTPAAGKVYRSAGATSEVQQELRVGVGATLEWLPHEMILHDGARLDVRTRVQLAPGARFAALEMLCFGLPARGERWARAGAGRCRQRLEVWRGEAPLAIERGRFDAGAPVHEAAWGLRGAPITGTLLAAPAPAAAVVDAIRARAAALPDGDLAAATLLAQGEVLACRYLGPSAERGRGFLHDAWRLWRPAALGRPASAPRIWAT